MQAKHDKLATDRDGPSDYRQGALTFILRVAVLVHIPVLLGHYMMYAHSGIDTSWLHDAVGMVMLVAINLWFDRDRKAHASHAIHLTILTAAYILSMSYLHGEPTAQWWLIIVAFAASLLAETRAAVVWCIILLLLTSVGGLLARQMGWVAANHETAAQSAVSRLAFSVAVILVAWVFRVAVGRREAQLRKTAEELAISNTAKDQLLKHLGHEVRTPLHGVIALTEQAMAATTDVEQRKRLAGVLSSANVLAGQVTDLMDFSEDAGTKAAETPVAFRPAEVLQDVQQSLLPLAKSRGLALELSVDAECGTARMGHPEVLQRIAHKLISNALLYTSVGRVDVSLRQSGLLELEVADTGIGIAQELQERLFQPFVRGDHSSTRRVGGLGLGLATVRRLVEHAGGEIRVSSAPNLGTRFNVGLPLPIAAGASDSASSEADAPLARSPSPRRILVCDDDMICREVLAETLRQMGHSVSVAEDGEDACVRLIASSVDVIITDLEMPRMDGRALLRWVRERENDQGSARCPVIAATAHMRPHDLDQRIDGDFDSWLFKPFLFADVYMAVETVIAASATTCEDRDGGFDGPAAGQG